MLPVDRLNRTQNSFSVVPRDVSDCDIVGRCNCKWPCISFDKGSHKKTTILCTSCSCFFNQMYNKKLFDQQFFTFFFNKNSMTRFWPIFFSFLKTFFQLVFSQQVFSTGCPREPYPLFFGVTVFNIFTLWSYHAIHMKTDIKRNTTSTQSLLTEQ